MASPHGRFFAAAVKKAATVDYFLAVSTEGGKKKNTTFSHFPHDLVQSVCALHKYETFALSRVLRPYPSINLDVARSIYNYRLTRARRMVECAYGIR